MAKLVKNVYGDALFELALEQNSVEEYEEEVKALLEVLETNPEFLQMMTHPNIDKEEKLKMVETVFKGRTKDEIVGLIRMIVEKNHFQELADVFRYYIKRAMKYRNVGIAEVTTPMELSEKKKKEVEDRLLSTTEYVSFEMRYHVDPSLIGGMVVRIGDRVVDSSVKTKLDLLTRELLRN
jgi:F-type H+-transporting ATPase subunit delta